jgi:hypothetical protein
LIRDQTELITFRTECAQGKWLKVSDVAADINKHAGRIRTVICQKIINELPAKAIGQDESQIREFCEHAVADAMRDYEAWVASFLTPDHV